jgi:dihydroorotate dehydrogenase electron transfer subunit
LRSSGRAPKQTGATLRKRTGTGRGSYLFSLDVGPDFPRAEPGQFVHVTVGSEFALRRPFSVAGDDGRGTIELLVEVRGRGTKGLAALEEGSRVDVLGPLGSGFSMPRDGETAVLVAGGIGVAGLKLLAERLAGAGLGARVLVGARTRDALVTDVLPHAQSLVVEIATDDGSAGFHGPVTGLLEARLPDLGRAARLYSCGPPAMLREVGRISQRAGLTCEVLAEEIMACGVGACRGCVIRTRGGYRSACSDGPVFDAAEILFDELLDK